MIANYLHKAPVLNFDNAAHASEFPSLDRLEQYSSANIEQEHSQIGPIQPIFGRCVPVANPNEHFVQNYMPSFD